MSLADDGRALAAELTRLGVPTTTASSSLVIPGGWLTPTRVEADRLDGSIGSVRWTLYLIAGDLNSDTVLDQVAAMFETVATVGTAGDFVTLALPNYGELPALAVTIET